MGYVAIAVQLLGGILQGSAASQAAKAEENLLKINAQLASYDAAEAVALGKREATDIRTGANRLVGTQRAMAGGSGLSANEGAALDVQADTAYQAELDAQRQMYNREREAWGYSVQSSVYTYKAGLKKKEATDGFLSGILGGASQAGGTYAAMK